MTKIIKLWPYQAINEALKDLTEFEKTGSREGFKKWTKGYSEKIEDEKKHIKYSKRKGDEI